MMMTISLRLNEEDGKLFKKYAEMHGMTVSEMVRRAVIENIEDEYDLRAGMQAYEEYVRDGKKSKPLEDLWKECDL